MTHKSKPSALAIALANAPALLNWYKAFKDLTEQFVASEIGRQLLTAAALQVHPIYTGTFGLSWEKAFSEVEGKFELYCQECPLLTVQLIPYRYKIE